MRKCVIPSVLVVRGRLTDPDLVAAVVNRVADLGTETARHVSQQEALQARNDIKLQLDEAKTRLDAATARLDQRRTTSQLELVQRDVDSALDQRGSLLDLQIKIEAEKARLNQAEQELSSRPRLDTVVRSIDADPALLEAARNGDGKPQRHSGAADQDPGSQPGLPGTRQPGRGQPHRARRAGAPESADDGAQARHARSWPS